MPVPVPIDNLSEFFSVLSRGADSRRFYEVLEAAAAPAAAAAVLEARARHQHVRTRQRA